MTETIKIREEFIRSIMPDHIKKPIYYSSVLDLKKPHWNSGLLCSSYNYSNPNLVPIPKKWYKNDTSGYIDNRWGTNTLKITEKKFNEKLAKEIQKQQRFY